MKFGDMTIKQIAEICKGKERCHLCPFYNANAPMMCRFDGKTDPAEWDIGMDVNANTEDHLIENGVTINKDSIWITNKDKEALFVNTLERSYNLQDEELTDWMNYAFSADNLERYCSGDTGAFDDAYESIGKRLRNEYRQWCESRKSELL
jgi:hypothetical protein